MMSSVVVLDNGGGLCKAGFGGERDPAAVVPNCLGRSAASKKWLVADQLQAPDADVTSVSVRRPLDRGYLVNPDLQREVWDRVLRSLLRADPAHSSLLLVEPLFNPPSIQRTTDELIFEDFGFRSLLVVDCGFSFTHAAPVLQNFTLNYGVRRLDLGGKALTNYLKELVSYRSVNVMDETLIVDHAKEQLCFVSLDVPRDLQLASTYLLLADSQLPISRMNQAGLAECIVRAVQSCHPHLRPLLFESIILTGGSTLFPQFRERLERELRPLVRDDYKLKITTQEDPILGVWRGGSLLASSPEFESMCVTKLELSTTANELIISAEGLNCILKSHEPIIEQTC
ncbi:hypothetical protein J5N97_000556 [Dioscorea zingiberensis]|uniref:Actin-related protein 6 n=1 Tax=Dioscorea zingiberensis TaxID=325984 RepID=A0A9D5BUV6_9LILI|nr:hypothetical protein J5N97_000556 [Dioscorea zingiberensis]